MQQRIYTFQKGKVLPRYTFVSEGRRSITKIVEFAKLDFAENLYNLAFGDLLPDGIIDDQARSNNGDIIRIMATLVRIITDFTDEYSHAQIFFTGSTEERQSLYQRILRAHYANFSEHFVITGLIEVGDSFLQVPFDLNDSRQYLYFLIKKI